MDIFAVIPDEGGVTDAFRVIINLRNKGLVCDMNLVERSMKAQMKQANREQARFALIFGEEERSRGAVTVRNMADSSQEEVCFGALEAYFNK